MGERTVENRVPEGESVESHRAGRQPVSASAVESPVEACGKFEVLVWSQLELGDAYQRELEAIWRLAV
ncbi:MAG: hypothetical protein FJ297_08945 [Planctomycetes bacterium]|nr:hypothetical protein [Planctomycetota bacterium]